MICIGIAFVFWLLTKLSDEYKSTVSVKVVYSTPKGKVFSFPPPKQVEVELKGTGWDLLGVHFQTKSPTIELQITEEQAKTSNALPIESRIYKLFPKATVLDIRPNTIQIALEETATKVVPVRIDQQIELAPLHGFVDSINIEPKQVQITGPASVVRNINEWKTVPVIMQDVKNDIRQEIPLQRHSNGNVVFTPASVRCDVRIDALTEKKFEVPVNVHYLGDSSIQITILPKKVEVACMVVLSRYDDLQPADFEAYVDFQSGQTNSTEGLRVRLSAPPAYVQQVHFYPRTVDYIARKLK